jgi:hypothetical protein
MCDQLAPHLAAALEPHLLTQPPLTFAGECRAGGGAHGAFRDGMRSISAAAPHAASIRLG